MRGGKNAPKGRSGQPQEQNIPPTYKPAMGLTGVIGNSGLAKVVTGFSVVPELYDKSPDFEASKTMQNAIELKT